MAKSVQYNKRGLKRRPTNINIPAPPRPPKARPIRAGRTSFTVQRRAMPDERREAIQEYRGRVKPIKIPAPPRIIPDERREAIEEYQGRVKPFKVPERPTPQPEQIIPPPVETKPPVRTTAPVQAPIGQPFGPGATAPPSTEVIGKTTIPSAEVNSTISGIPIPTIESQFGYFPDILEYVQKITGRKLYDAQTGQELALYKTPKVGKGHPVPWYMPPYSEEENPNKFNPGYEPTFWEDPRNVAMVYHGVIGLSNVEWADKEFVKSAYDYFKMANGNDDWTNWKYLAPDDPARTFLQSGSQPPIDYILTPKQYQNYLLNALYATPAEQRDPQLIAKLTPQYRMALEYEQYVKLRQAWAIENTPEWMAFAKTLTTDPAISGMLQMGVLGLFTLNPLVALNMAVFGGLTGASTKINDPFWASVAGTASTGAMFAGSVAPGAGHLFGAIGGGIAGGLTNILTRGTEVGGVTGYNLADGILRLMDMPAEFLEGVLGTGQLLSWAAKEPELYGTPEQLLGDIVNTYNAGRLLYTVASVPNQDQSHNWINIFPYLGYLWASAKGDEEELKKIKFAKPGETFNLSGDNPFPYAIGATQAAMMNAARKRLIAGEDIDQILLEYQYLYGLSGLSAELIGHMVLDPLNIAPRAESAAVRGIAGATGNKAIVLGWSGRQGLGIFGGLKNYKALVESGAVGVFGDSLTAFEKSLAGLSERGIPKSLDPDFHYIALKGEGNVLHFANPALRWADELLMLTPESRVEALHVRGIDAYNALADRFRGDIEGWRKAHSDIAEAPATAAANFSTAAYASPIMYSLQRAMKSFLPLLDDSIADYHTADVERVALFRVSDVLGIEPKDILIRLGEENGAAKLFDEFAVKLTQSDYPLAARLLEEINAGNLKVEDIEKIGEKFLGDDAIPWHPDELMVKMSGQFNKTVADWAIKAYGAKETSFGFRFANTLKKAQSALLLSWNPGYFVNNTINNAISRWASHIWGYATGSHREVWWTRFGRRLARERAGLGAAATGVDLDIEGLKPGEAGTNVGKPMGEHISPEGERELRKIVNMNKGALGQLNKALDFVNRLGPATTGSRKVEIFESQNAMYFAAKQAWEGWESGRLISQLPPRLKADIVRIIGPKAPEWFRSILRNSMSADEISAALLDTAPRYDTTTVLDRVIDDMNKGVTDPDKLLNPDIIRDTMTRGQLLDNLKQDLQGVTTADGVRNAFSNLRKSLNDNADQMNLNDLVTRANEVWGMTAAGKWLELFNLSNEKNLKIAEFEANHYVEMDAVRARDEQMRDAEEAWSMIRRNWDDAITQTNRERQRIRKFELAADDGIYKGMGLGDEKVNLYNDTIRESYTLWDKFWEFENAAKKRYFDNRKKMDRVTANAEYQKMRSSIDKKYRQTQRLIYGYEIKKADGTTYHRPGVMDRANNQLLDAIKATYGIDAGKVADAWIKDIARINIELDSMMTEQRAIADTLPLNERRREWQLFLDNDYLPKTRDLFNNNTRRMVELYCKITGQKPPPIREVPVKEVGKRPPTPPSGEAPAPEGAPPTPPPAAPTAPPTPEAPEYKIDYEEPRVEEEREPQVVTPTPEPEVAPKPKMLATDISRNIIKVTGDIDPDFIYTRRTTPEGERVSRNLEKLSSNIITRINNAGGIEGVHSWDDLVTKWDTVKTEYERIMRTKVENKKKVDEIKKNLPTIRTLKELPIAKRLDYLDDVRAMDEGISKIGTPGKSGVIVEGPEGLKRLTPGYPNWWGKYGFSNATYFKVENGKKVKVTGLEAWGNATKDLLNNGIETLKPDGTRYAIFEKIDKVINEYGSENIYIDSMGSPKDVKNIEEYHKLHRKAAQDALLQRDEYNKPVIDVYSAGDLWKTGNYDDAARLINNVIDSNPDILTRFEDSDWIEAFGSLDEATKAFNHQVQQVAKDAGIVVDVPKMEELSIEQAEILPAIIDELKAENGKLKAELELEKERRINQVGYDALTGLKKYIPNATDITLAPFNREVEAANAFSVIDMAGMKYLNDKYGHDAGDALLFGLAYVARENNIPLYRTGGDEFVIATTDVPTVLRMSDTLDKGLKSLPILVQKPDGSYTVIYGYGIRFGTGVTYGQADKQAIAARRRYYRNHPAIRKYIEAGKPAPNEAILRSSIFPGATVVDIPSGRIEDTWFNPARKYSISEIDDANTGVERAIRVGVAKQEYRDKFREYVVKQTDPEQKVPYSGELEPAPKIPREVEQGALYRYLSSKPRETEEKMLKNLKEVIDDRSRWTLSLKGDNPHRWQAYQELAKHNGWDLEDYTYDSGTDKSYGKLTKLGEEEALAEIKTAEAERTLQEVLTEPAVEVPEKKPRLKVYRSVPKHLITSGSQYAPKFSDNPLRERPKVIYSGGGDQARGDLSQGFYAPNNPNLRFQISHDTLAEWFNPKIVSSEYGKGWVIHSQERFKSLDEAKNWLENLYIRMSEKQFNPPVERKEINVIEPIYDDPDAVYQRLEENNFDELNWLPNAEVAINFIDERIPGANSRYEIIKHDTVSGQDHRGLRIRKGDAYLDVQVKEDGSSIGINWIEANPPGTGLGTQFMEAMRQYANLKNKELIIIRITNPKFYERFSWLDQGTIREYQTTSYRPWEKRTEPAILEPPLEMPKPETMIPTFTKQGQSLMFGTEEFGKIYTGLKHPIGEKFDLNGRKGMIVSSEEIEGKKFYVVEYEDAPGWKQSIAIDIIDAALEPDRVMGIHKLGYEIRPNEMDMTINGEKIVEIVYKRGTEEEIAYRPDWSKDSTSDGSTILGYDPHTHNIVYITYDGKIKKMPGMSGGETIDGNAALNQFVSRKGYDYQSKMTKKLVNAISEGKNTVDLTEFFTGLKMKDLNLGILAFQEIGSYIGYELKDIGNNVYELVRVPESELRNYGGGPGVRLDATGNLVQQTEFMPEPTGIIRVGYKNGKQNWILAKDLQNVDFNDKNIIYITDERSNLLYSRNYTPELDQPLPAYIKYLEKDAPWAIGKPGENMIKNTIASNLMGSANLGKDYQTVILKRGTQTDQDVLELLKLEWAAKQEIAKALGLELGDYHIDKKGYVTGSLNKIKPEKVAAPPTVAPPAFKAGDKFFIDGKEYTFAEIYRDGGALAKTKSGMNVTLSKEQMDRATRELTPTEKAGWTKKDEIKLQEFRDKLVEYEEYISKIPLPIKEPIHGEHEIHSIRRHISDFKKGIAILEAKKAAAEQSQIPIRETVAGGAGEQPPTIPPVEQPPAEPPPPPGGSNNIAGDVPPGVMESITAPEFRSELEGDFWKKSVEPIVNAMEDKFINEGPTEGYKIPPELMPEVNKYLRTVMGDMETAKAYTTAYATSMRDFALLNYSMRRGADNWLNLIYPYQFWYTRTAMNWAMRAFDRPTWYANYYRFRKFMQANKEEYGFPSRLKNKVGILAPYLPDWTSDKFYVDPLNNIFPFENFITPMAEYQRMVNENEREAEYLLKQWADEGTISDAEAATAAQSHEGDLWRQATETVKTEQDWSPLGFMDWVMSPALYLTVPWYLITGKTLSLQPREDLPLLPITRTGNAIKAITEDSMLGSIGNFVGNLMATPERVFRKAFSMSEFGDWGNYYIDRQISNMVGEGACSLRDAQLAMIEREGPIYAEAVRRTMLENAFKVPGALPTYAALHTNWKLENRTKDMEDAQDMATAILFGFAPAGLLPDAELQARQLKDEYDAARKAYNNGDTQAMDRFFDDYPEYEARSGLFLEPEQRLRQFIISDIWDIWGTLGSVQKEQIVSSFGNEFQVNFLDGKTRNYETIKDETLAFWLHELDGYVPKTVEPVEPTGYQEMQNVPPQMMAEVQAYRSTRNANFPNWYALQQKYYSLPPGAERKAFLNQYPILKEYWDWNRAYKESHPNIEQYAQQYEPPDYDYSFLSEFSTPLYKQLFKYYVNGTPLSEGAIAELNRIWTENGKPEYTLDGFINKVIRPLLIP